METKGQYEIPDFSKYAQEELRELIGPLCMASSIACCSNETHIACEEMRNDTYENKET